MTMTQSDQLKHGQHKTGFRNFHETLDLNVTAPEQEQQPDMQWEELLENHPSRYTELPQRMEKHKDSHSAEVQQHGEQVPPQTKTLEGCVDHLLILAQSAEIVAHSEDGEAHMQTNDQHKESHNLVDPCPQKHASNITRLTQIRKEARCKYLILDQGKAEDHQCKHLWGRTIRLSQIKHQARSESKNDLSPQGKIIQPRNELRQGRMLRLSQMKRQARSKGNSTVKERNEECTDGSLHYNRFRDNNKEIVIGREFAKEDICQEYSGVSMVEGVPAHKFLMGASHSSVVRHDDQNLRERQRTARRIRAFKTKNLRQRLRTQCIRNSANVRLQAAKTSPIGLTSITNSPSLSHSVTLLKDKDLVACQQELLPKTSRCDGKLRENLGAEKHQEHFGCNDSPETSMIPNVLPMQNNQYLAVARQHRAERMEEKRVSKDKQQNQNPNNPLHVFSEAQKESVPVKRLRLTQLRREVRLGNQCSVIQGPAEN